MKKHSLQDDIGYWLNRLRMEVHSSFEAKLEQHGISVPQWCVLVTLYNKDGENVSEISAFIDTDKGFVSRIIEQLVQMDLVARREGKDRRSQILRLQPKAKKLVDKLISCARENEGAFFGVLSDSEKRSLKSVLIKLLKNAGINKLGGFLNE